MEKYLSYFTSQVCVREKRTSNGYWKKLASVDFLKNELRKVFTQKTHPKPSFSGKFRSSWSQHCNIWTSFCTFLKELLTKCEKFRRPNSKIHAGQIVSIYKTEPFRHIKLHGTRYWQICRLNVGGGLRTAAFRCWMGNSICDHLLVKQTRFMGKVCSGTVKPTNEWRTLPSKKLLPIKSWLYV